MVRTGRAGSPSRPQRRLSSRISPPRGPEALPGCDQGLNSRPRPGGLQSLAAVVPIETRTVDPYLAPTKQCFLRPARRRGTGRPPGTGVEDHAFAKKSDIPVRFSQFETVRTGRAGSPSRPQRKLSSRISPPRGPEALQVVIRASIVVLDLEGCSPISANLFCKISALAIRVSGLVR